MKLAVLHLDWMPVIPDGKFTGSDARKDMRDSTCFRAVDGWSITKLPSGEFQLEAEWLPLPVVIGDGYTYVVEPPPAPAVVAMSTASDEVCPHGISARNSAPCKTCMYPPKKKGRH